MATTLSDNLKEKISTFLSKKKRCDLLSAYLYYVEQKFDLHPIAFPQGKLIFKTMADAIDKLEKKNKLWHETEICIVFEEEAVNQETKKVYICPFSGKVFGDNTHPNPQDAIYDWVANCPENRERSGGLKVKRFYVSEDPEVIQNYITPRKKPITKKVYSSVVTGKLFNSKKSVVDDFKKHHTKPMSLVEVQSQSRLQVEDSFIKFIEEQLTEDRLSGFVQAMAEHEEFFPYVQQWADIEEE